LYPNSDSSGRESSWIQSGPALRDRDFIYSFFFVAAAAAAAAVVSFSCTFDAEALEAPELKSAYFR